MVVGKKTTDMIRFILFNCLIIALVACSTDKDTFELDTKPSVIDYQNYKKTISYGTEWNSGLPIVRDSIDQTFQIVEVKQGELVLETSEFSIDAAGVVSLSHQNTQELGEYTLAVQLENSNGSITNTDAINISILESVTPQIVITSNEFNMLVNPAGEPVNGDGELLEGILDGIRLTFIDMTIGEVLMKPSSEFLMDRESNHVEDGSSEIGVVEMVGPFEPGVYNLEFVGTVSGVSEILTVNVTKLNLPYDKDIFSFDLSEEDQGARNNVTEDNIGGLNTHLVYGALKSGKAFWNVQPDKNHPADEYDTTPILRWLPFNAASGFDNSTANKSQSVTITDELIDVSDLQELRVNAAFVSNKIADLTNDLLRCDILVATEEQYQAMLSMATQAEKKAAVETWYKMGTSVGAVPVAGVADGTGYGYFELQLATLKADLPVSASNQLRVLYSMVADKDGANPGYIALQSFEIDGRFLDSE